MREVRVHGRFGQPVGKLVAALGKHAMKKGLHVQIFNSFAPFRPGGPMYAVLRTAAEPVRERSANNVAPDIVVVLDNSLFASQDLTKGLKPGGVIMALGVDNSVLGNKAGEYAFVPLDPFICGKSMDQIEAGLISGLESQHAFQNRS
jgi:pyruvate ferredoxin oxidoreductase gamma subunit